MSTRRKFLQVSSATAIGAISLPVLLSSQKRNKFSKDAEDLTVFVKNHPVVISTWNHGIPANEAAWKVLKNNGSALDAVEQGVMVPRS